MTHTEHILSARKAQEKIERAAIKKYKPKTCEEKKEAIEKYWNELKEKEEYNEKQKLFNQTNGEDG